MSSAEAVNLAQSQRHAVAVFKEMNAAFRIQTVRDGSKAVVSVDLSGTKFSDADCEHLSEMTHLESLRLMSCKHVTNEGLVSLKKLSRLRTLFLTSTSISNSGLENLKGLKNLNELNLSSTRVSDSGLRHLRGLENLSYLALFETRVSDAGLEHLAALQGLERLWLGRTSVTEKGVSEFLRKLPNCRIDR